MEDLPLEELSSQPWRKQVLESIDRIVQAYFNWQLKNGIVGENTELQLVCAIKKGMEQFKLESSDRRRTLKEILRELQSKSVKDDEELSREEDE